jgi:carbamate kinase
VKLVVALGGNALIRRGEPLEAEVQRANLARAADSLATLAHAHQLVVTHGNGPQVGLLALQSEALKGVTPYPLDVLGAESEGMIGYLIQQALESRLPERRIVTLLTQVVVRRDDPAFARPSKPIGPWYGEVEARALARSRGWTMVEDRGRWRRVVPSPEPLRIVELAAIRMLLESGALVICAGGGGIPVENLASGAVRGVEAVIDKDLAAALLARELNADALLLLTDVEGVFLDWGTPLARRLHETSVAELRAQSFASGSMAPKVEAVCRFIEGGGRFAGIGRLENAARILEGRSGTVLRH